jgi:hypothetical protein
MRAEASHTTFDRVEQDVDAPRKSASVIVLTTAELSPCTCPESCERDHDRD